MYEVLYWEDPQWVIRKRCDSLSEAEAFARDLYARNRKSVHVQVRKVGELLTELKPS